MEIRTAVVRDRAVRWRAAGTGDPLVLVHGLSGSGRWWNSVVPAFSARRRVHLVDLPRFGPALAPAEAAAWLGDWLDAAAIDDADVVGHSLGGLVCAQLASERPDRVRRLVLVAPAGVPAARPLLGHALPLLAALVEARHRAAHVVADGLRAGPGSLFRGALHAVSRDLRGDLGGIRAETLVVWGERDPLLPARLAREWVAALPAARSAIVGAGHVPMWDAPDDLARLVLEFLGERGDSRGEQDGP